MPAAIMGQRKALPPGKSLVLSSIRGLSISLSPPIALAMAQPEYVPIERPCPEKPCAK